VRLGFVTDLYYPWIGGPSILVRTLAQALARAGHSVSLLAPSPDGHPRVEAEGAVGVTRVRTVASPFGHNLRFAALPRQSVSRWLDETQPDVVHVHHPFPLSAAAVLAARRRGIPVAATNHTVPECTLWGIRGISPLYRPAYSAFALWLRWMLSRCDAVVTPTATAVESLRRLGYRGDVGTISNGVDCNRFSPGPPDPGLRDALNLDARPVVLYTGRLDADKDMQTWLRAAALLCRTVDAQFVVGGNGTDRSRLESLSRELGLDGRVRFIGYLPEESFPRVYRLADVYCITSPVELQSITTLEAIASGLPVAAARAGALPELVSDGQNGFLFEPGDSGCAARAMALLLQNEERRRSMSLNSRAIALRHEVTRTIAAYEKFLAMTSRMRRGAAGERAPAVGN